MALIHADDLDYWARFNVARDKLGELLRRLIHANIALPVIKTIRFLAHESNQLSGWDGILECRSETSWIPSSTSVWELGTGSNARQKIRDDFVERREKELPSGWDRKKTTYVAVTLRKLDDISNLLNELKEDSPWYDVEIIDAQGFEEWIEISPDVETWLQEQGIGPPPTVRTLSGAWTDWSEKTHPPVSIKLVLAGRDQNAADLRSNLASPGVPINVQADSPAEAVAFVYSVIECSDDALFREHFLDRAIVINHVRDAVRFRTSPKPQNIILTPPATNESLSLGRCGHTVINALGNSSLAQKIDIRVARPLHSDFENALLGLGLSKEEAEVQARACGGSPSIWRVWNLINSGDPEGEIPDWGKQECSALVVPAVLLGGWSESSEGDKEVIGVISGRPFEEYRDQLNRFVSSDNPLLIKVGDAWVISAPATAFALTSRHITPGHLEALSNVVKTVFAEVDPTIDLSPDERPYVGLKDIRMKHSTWLRDGLASSLLRIAVIGHALERNGVIPHRQSCQLYVDSIVREFPGLREDWRLLASLKDQLPVLAEAAPLPFVEALECLLQGEPEKLRPIFIEGKGLLPHASHTGLLWALETLAWEPKYLSRVAIILGKLAEIDPGGQLSNRPLNTLKEIFLAWHPGTSANLDQMLEALDLVLERFDEIGWDLLRELLPKNSDVASPTHEPQWRDFGRSKKELLTNRIVWIAYKNYVDRAIRQAGTRADRCKMLVDICDDVPDEIQSSIETTLIELSKKNLSQAERKIIWEAIRHFLNRHRAYADASWALPEERLKRLDAVKQYFDPGALIDQIAWLFNEDFPDLPVRKADYETERDELNKLRDEAVRSVWAAGGIELIKNLVDQVSHAGLVGVHLLGCLNDEDAVIGIIEQTSHGTEKERFFARCLSGVAYEKFGISWPQLLLSKARHAHWSSEEVINLLLNFPDSQETFDFVESLGEETQRAYWVSRPRWIRCKDNESILHALTKFKEHGRAIDALVVGAQQWKSKDARTIFQLLDQAIRELNESKDEVRLGNDSYWLKELFKWLRHEERVDKGELARREYAYLPLLAGSLAKTDLALHEILADDPEFFVRVLCDLYKPASARSEESEPTKEVRLRAEFALQLLRSWKKPPGVTPSREVEPDKFGEWVKAARQLAAKSERIDVADREIGKVLFYFPSDPGDSVWPHLELRQLLETLQNDNIETGIELEQFNSRGVVNKAMFEGGAQERLLAQKWRDIAEKLGLRWPRTRAMCERIAASWESDGKREDERAEQQRLQQR
jgi:hypothetical protein